MIVDGCHRHCIATHHILSEYNIKLKDKHRQGNIGIVVYGGLVH